MISIGEPEKTPVPLQQLDYSLTSVKKQGRQAASGRASEQRRHRKNTCFFAGNSEIEGTLSVFCIKKYADKLIFY
ncbi:MAG: hypothetical protein MR581_09440 [Lachnospiraceae bacterium]|nr:hypothetical protein [Lachnospiraceae bacterium]